MESKPGERKVDIFVYVGRCGDEGNVCRLVGGACMNSFIQLTAVWPEFTPFTATLQGLLGLRQEYLYGLNSIVYSIEL